MKRTENSGYRGDAQFLAVFYRMVRGGFDRTFGQRLTKGRVELGREQSRQRKQEQNPQAEGLLHAAGDHSKGLCVCSRVSKDRSLGDGTGEGWGAASHGGLLGGLVHCGPLKSLAFTQ